MLISSNVSYTFKEPFQQLFVSLRDEYMVIVDTIDGRIAGVPSAQIDYEEWIVRLEDKQKSLKQITEISAAARDYNRSHGRSN